jgi:phytoene/squalene synthetase
MKLAGEGDNEPMRLGSDPDFSLMPELFARPLRPHVHAFGRFVRLAEAVTDNSALARDEKQARLTALEAALTGDNDGPLWSMEANTVAQGLRNSLKETTIPVEHARHILQALRRDARDHVCASWHDLMLYCQFAAAPIGRYLLQLVGEDLARCVGPADALCGGSHILRQLRDCEDPTIRFNRLCIPRQFLDDAMITPRHLRAPSAKGQTRAVLDRVLDGVDHLLADAAPLPVLIRDRGLGTHASIVHCRARRLVGRFRKRDPIRERVGLTSWQRTLCRWSGTLRGLTR